MRPPAGSGPMCSRRRAAAVLPVLGTAALFLCHPMRADEQSGPPANESVSADTRQTRSFPDYVTGDECLFCHRRQIGPTWQSNPHQRTVRRATPDDHAVRALRNRTGDSADFLMGSKRLIRFLRRSRQYGKLDLLTAVYRPPGAHGRLESVQNRRWDSEKFAAQCAGCHTTAVDSQTGAFAATGLDCFVCHGDVDLAHTNDTRHIFLSQTRREPRPVVSVCGQCHLRGGISRRTGRPWPDTFLPGEELSADFEVDFSDAAIAALHPMDRHIFLNARAVLIDGDETTTCLSCHEVHAADSAKHESLNDGALCAVCHRADSGGGDLRESLLPDNVLEEHSEICEY